MKLNRWDFYMRNMKRNRTGNVYRESHAESRYSNGEDNDRNEEQRQGTSCKYFDGFHWCGCAAGFRFGVVSRRRTLLKKGAVVQKHERTCVRTESRYMRRSFPASRLSSIGIPLDEHQRLRLPERSPTLRLSLTGPTMARAIAATITAASQNAPALSRARAK